MHLLADITGFTAPAAACGVAWAGVFAHGTFVAASTVWGPVVSRASGDGPPQVALTFDGGPAPDSTGRVLDALGELGVRAAFFVGGRDAQRFPVLVERIHGEGHVVGNRGWDRHPLGLLRDRSYWSAQIRRTDALVEQVIGRRPALFRPPAGVKTWHLMSAADRAGHTVVTWSRRMSAGAAADASRGDVILVRVGRGATAEAAVRSLVSSLINQGLSPRRLDEVLGTPAYRTPPEVATVRPTAFCRAA